MGARAASDTLIEQLHRPGAPPDARRGAAGPRAARLYHCGAFKKASVAGCRARPAAAPRAAAQDTPRINESFDTRRLALVAAELAANARPLTELKNAQVRARRPLGLGLGCAPAEGEGGQGPEQGQVPEGRAPGAKPGVSVRSSFMRSRRTGTPSRRWRRGAVPARRRGDAAHLAAVDSSGMKQPSRRWRRRGRNSTPPAPRRHVAARRSSA